jgi:hypothetical protein
MHLMQSSLVAQLTILNSEQVNANEVGQAIVDQLNDPESTLSQNPPFTTYPINREVPILVDTTCASGTVSGTSCDVDNDDSDDDLSTGAIVGIAIGAAVGAILLAILLVCCIRSFQAKRNVRESYAGRHHKSAVTKRSVDHTTADQRTENTGDEYQTDDVEMVHVHV